MSWVDEYLTQQSANAAAGAGPVSPDVENEPLWKTLAHTALTPLAWLGETVDKTLGARTIRELLAGKGASSFLHLIPFSDTLGITDPTKAATGRDLGRQWGLMDQEDTTGNFWGGLGLEVALDPSNWLTFGTKAALTGAGKTAAMAGTLEKTAAGRIAAGQAGLASLHSPWFTNMLGLPKFETALGTGKTAEGLVNAIGAGVDRLYDMPGIGTALGKTVSAFDYLRGHTGDPRYVRATAGLDDVQQGLRAKLNEKFMPVLDRQTEALNYLDSLGIARPEAEQAFNRLYNAHIEGTPLGSAYFPSLAPADRAAAAAKLDNLAQAAAGSGRQFYDDARQLLREYGKVVPENQSVWLNEYAHQRAQEYGRSLMSQQTGRSLPHEILPGGANQINDLVNLPPEMGGVAGILRRKAAGTQLDEAAARQSIEAFAQRHAADVIAQRDTLLQAASQMPLTPDVAKRIARLQALTDETILGKSRGLGQWLGELDPALGDARRGFFRPDPAGNAMEYAMNMASQATTAHGVLDTLVREAKPTAALRQGVTDAGEFVPLTKALDKLGLNASETSRQGKKVMYDYGGKLELLDRLRDAGKTTLQTNRKLHVDRELGTLAVPQDLVDVLTKEMKGPQRGVASGLRQTLDQYGTAIRSWLTVPFAPYHLRNTLEAGLQQGLAGSLSPAAIKEAALYRAGAIQDPARAALLDQRAREAMIHGAAFTNQPVEMLGKSVVGKAEQAISPFPVQGRAGERIAEHTLDIPAKGSPESLASRVWDSLAKRGGYSVTENPNQILKMSDYGTGGGTVTTQMLEGPRQPGSVGQKVKEWLNQFRPSQLPEGERYMAGDSGVKRFLPNLDPATSPIVQRGLEVHQATDQVNRFAQFNALRDQGYAPAAAAKIVRESQLDYSRLTSFEQDLRRVMPFYSFGKQNLERTARQLVENPGGINTVLRTANEARQDASVPGYVTPGMAVPVGTTADGKTRYLSGFGLPVEDELLGAVTSLASGHPQEAGRRLLSSVDPLLKTLIEAGTDTSLYSGRRLSEQKPNAVASLGGVLPDSIARVVGSALSATPASRYVGNVDKAAGVATGSKSPDALLSILLGTRLTDVDPAQARSQAARQALEESLMGSGLANARHDVYLKPEFKGQDTPEVQQAQVMLQLLNELERASAARRKAQALQQVTGQ